MKFPTWDLIISIVFLLIVAYNFLLQRDKIIKTIMAAYIGLAIATVWGEAVHAFLANNLGQAQLSSDASSSSTKIGIFFLVTILLSIRSDQPHVPKKTFKYPPFIMMGVYSLMATSLIFVSIISFLDENSKTFLLSNSTLALFIDKYSIWFFVLPVILLIATGFASMAGRTKHRGR